MIRANSSGVALRLFLACGLAACSADSQPSSSTSMSPSISPPAIPGAGAGTSGSAAPSSKPVGTSGSAGSTSTPPATPPSTAGRGGAPAIMMMMTSHAGSAAPAATAGSSAPATPPTPHGTSTCLKPGSGNYGEPGPYQVGMMDVDLGMIESSQHTGMFTIFYPMPLEESCPHPIAAWGNGTTVMGSQTYAFFNSNAASWGVVVAASQEDNTGSGNFHKAGIDYLLKQNEDASSMFYHKLSTRAGVAGHSQGGFGATTGSQHPNVEALVSVAGGGVPKANVATLCLTGTMDMVEQSCTAEYMAASGPAFLGDWMNGDHVTTETIAGYLQKDPGTLQMQRLLAGWFRCFLADDGTACALFKGAPDNCGICKDPGWAKHESRNM